MRRSVARVIATFVISTSCRKPVSLPLLLTSEYITIRDSSPWYDDTVWTGMKTPASFHLSPMRWHCCVYGERKRQSPWRTPGLMKRRDEWCVQLHESHPNSFIRRTVTTQNLPMKWCTWWPDQTGDDVNRVCREIYNSHACEGLVHKSFFRHTLRRSPSALSPCAFCIYMKVRFHELLEHPEQTWTLKTVVSRKKNSLACWTLVSTTGPIWFGSQKITITPLKKGNM